MKNRILSTAILAALGITTGVVQAAVDLKTGVSNAVYPSNLKIETQSIASQPMNMVQFISSLSLDKDQPYFVRVDLTGATFKNVVGTTALSMYQSDCTTLAASASAQTVTIKEGGAVDDAYVIFSAQYSNTQPAKSCFKFMPGDVSAGSGVASQYKVSSASDTQIQMRLFNLDTAASQPQNAGALNIMSSASGPFLKFAPAAALTSAGTQTATASVASSYTEFEASATSKKAVIGKFSFKLPTNNVVDALDTGATGSISAASSVFSFGAGTSVSKLVFKGNFSAMATAGGTGPVTSFMLSASTSCTPVTGGLAATAITSSGDGSTVEFALSDALVGAIGGGADTYLCAEVSGTASIEATLVTGQFVGVGQSAYSNTSSDEIQIGEIKRGGTELQATFTTNLAVAANRFTFSNNGNTAAPIIGIKVLNNAGTTEVTDLAGVALPIEIPAGGVLNIQRSDIAVNGKTVIFSIGGSSDNIKGIYQYAPTVDGSQTVTQMVTPTYDSGSK